MRRIKVLSSDLAEIETIYDVLSASRTEIINSDNTLSFSVLLTKQNTALFNATNVLELGGDYFDISKYKKGQAEDGRLTCDVDCEHISYRLNNSTYDKGYFTEIGTPTDVLSVILSGTGFLVGTVEFTSSVTYSAQEKKSRRGLLIQFAEYLGGELLFSGFTVSIVKQRGNTEPRDLISEGCISVISKTLDKTKADDNGNPTISYECTAFNPEPLALGDTVLLDYETLEIGVTLRIVSLTTNPYNKFQANFSISNVVPTIEDAAYKIATSTVFKDAAYNGCRIGPEYGFEAIRNDKKARAFFKSDGMKFQSGDGTGTWKDRLYFDYDSDTDETVLVFDGKLSANIINALSVLISPNLYAEKATIAEITVDQLDTSSKIAKYSALDTSDVNYISIKDQTVQFISAKTDGSAIEQAKNRSGQALYWTDATYQTATTTETDYPVMQYAYTELVKTQISFESMDGVYEPAIVLGSGSGEDADNEKAYIWKSASGLQLKYVTNAGKDTELKLGDFVDAKMRRISSVDINKTTGSITLLLEGQTAEDAQIIYFTETDTSMTFTWPDSFAATISIS